MTNPLSQPTPSRILRVATLLLLLWLAPAARAELIGAAGVNAWDALNTAEQARLKTGYQSFFLHQSVGGDLEDGASANGYKFDYADSGATHLAAGLNGGLFASSNGNPAGKIDEFRRMALANRSTLKLAIMKFGYADIVADNLAAAQSAYLAAVDAIKAAGVRVLHVTPPLVFKVPADNAPKMQMRSWMISSFPDDIIFDLGDLESSDPGSGTRCQRDGSWEICDAIRSSAACPSLNQGVDAATGQGHLCYAPHAQRIAKAFLYAIYRAVSATPGETQPAQPPAIEYHHAGFDHYFITAAPQEAAMLDAGSLAGWRRTGERFSVFALSDSTAAQVCRFFSTAFAPKSSHFYTAAASECEAVKNNPNWQYEGLVFAMALASPAGTCPVATQALYRLYNNGQGGAPNHRYTTSPTVRASMLAQGWVAEGYGETGVIACVTTP